MRYAKNFAQATSFLHARNYLVRNRKYIDIFLSLLETKNLRQTCKEMSISLGTASKAINTLEEVLEVRLFIRQGRNGLLATTNALKFKEYTEKINNILKITTEAFTDTIEEKTSTDAIRNIQQKNQAKEKKLIKIACHNLAFKNYILPAIKELNKDNDYYFNFSILDRDDAINQMLSNKIDLIMYPIEGRLFAFLQQNCSYELIGEYDLCLFFNKNHPLANKPIEGFTLDDCKTLNIEPNNKKFLLQTYNEILDIQYPQFNFSTTTPDIMSLYSGLKENLWVLGLGSELKNIFDLDDIIIKKVKNNKIFSITTNWYCLYNKTDEQVKKDIRMIINNIKKYYAGRLLKE